MTEAKPRGTALSRPPKNERLRTRPIRAGVHLGCGLVMLVAGVQAAPSRPDAHTAIPLGTRGLQEPARLAALRNALSADPQNPLRAASYAMALIEAFRSTQEPHFLRAAEKTVQSFDEDRTDLPAQFYLARATVAQRSHHFQEAMVDLDRALALDPRNRQALLTRTAVLRLLGRLDEAARSVVALYQFADSLVACTAAADLASIRGETASAWALLREHVLPHAATAQPNVQLWIQSTSAEVAWRAGLYDVAEAHFKNALKIEPNNLYSILGYADLLLQQERHTDVLALGRDTPTNQDLRLRHLLAHIAQGDSPAETARLRARMETQFQVDRSYAEGRHYRTEARYALEVEHAPLKAFNLARKNWSEQKEPADAQLLLAASNAAGQVEFAHQFQNDLEQMGFALPKHSLPGHQPRRNALRSHKQ